MSLSVNPDKVLNTLIFILHGFGLWRTNPNFCYQIYGFLTASLVFVSSFFMGAYIIVLDSLTELIYLMSITMTVSCGCLKLFYVIFYNKEIRELVERVRHFRLENDKERALVNGYCKTFSIGALIYASIGIFSITSDVITVATLDHPVLPFAAWYPFWDWEHSNRDYWFAWTYQAFTVNTSIALLMAVDLYFVFLLLMIGIQIEIIGKRMENIDWAPKPTNKYQETSYKTIEGTAELIQCMKLHLNIIEFKKKTERIMNIPYLYQLITSSISISACLSIFVFVS